MVRPTCSAVALACCVLATACGGSVEGEYVGKKGESFFDSLTLRSDGRVEVVMIGVRHEGSYQVDGGQVTITSPSGERTPLRVDSSGCLTHPIAGTYCKSGGSPGSGSSADARSGGSSNDARRAGSSDPPASSEAPGAEVYEGRAREGQITLEFGAARKARITMVPTGLADAPERMSFDVSYAVDGDRVTVNLPGNEPLMLTRAGRDLEGTMNGETVRFVKR
jgi:hypothetical protein